MKHPQTYAMDLKNKLTPEKLTNISKYGCCAFVLLWCLGIEPDNDIQAVEVLSDMISAKVIESDCTVHWAEAVEFLTGRKSTVDFVAIKDLKGIKERTPVRFDYKGNSHWVGVERGMIAFNPLEYSQCVEKGRPTTKRVLHIKGV